MKAPTVLFRADASTDIGSGHIMRCIAMGQGLRELGARVIFASECPPGLQKRIEAESFEFIPVSASMDALDTAACARAEGADWLVLDGYHLGYEHQYRAKTAGLRVLTLDDYGHASRYAADIILNQNTSANAANYPQGPRLLLGPSYAMLREEFWPLRNFHRVHPEIASKLLITLGGGDPFNMTGRCLRALQGATNLQIRVVVGGANPHLFDIRRLADKMGAEVMQDITNMPDQLRWADFAVSASGSTTWETCYLGLPTLLVAFAENQVPLGEATDRLGAAKYMGWHENVDEATILTEVHNLASDRRLRQSLGTKGQELVDGFGKDRVAHAMIGSGLLLRKAVMRDASKLWEWSQDPKTRELATSGDEPLSLEAFTLQLSKRVADRESLFFIAEDESLQPVGYARFQCLPEDQTTCDLEFAVAPTHRRKGYATALLQAAERKVFGGFAVRIRALVRPENEASIRTLQSIGYVLEGTQEHSGVKVNVFTREPIAEGQ